MQKPTSDQFYTFIKKFSGLLTQILEEFIKQFLNTQVGQYFFKWFIDFIVTKFFDQLVKPIMRVAIIKVGYYYDVHDAENRIKKLKTAEESNDEDLYYRTLNDVLK